MDVDPDPLGAEGVEDRAAIDRQPVETELDEHEVPCRIGARVDGRQLESRVTCQPLDVARRELATSCQPLLEPFELRSAERGGDVGQSVVVAELDHRVGPVAAGRQLRLDAVVAEAAQGGGEVVAVGQDRATLPGRHDLGRMEAEHGHVGERADRPALERRAQRVRGVGDDRERPAGGRVGDRPECGVVGRLAGVVDRDDRACPFRDRCGDRARIDRAANQPRHLRTAASAPVYRTAFALATKVIGVVIASSPGPRPATAAAPWSAAVPELNATACRAPVTSVEAGLEPWDARSGRQPVGTQGGRRPPRCRARR